MQTSTTLARHFARLVSLLLYEPANTDEQKGTLRALAIVAREGSVVLLAGDDGLSADGEMVHAALPGVDAFLARLDSHRVAAVEVAAGATPSDLLAVARTLAGPAGPARPGAMADRATVRFISIQEMASLASSPDVAPEVSGPPLDPMLVPDSASEQPADDPLDAASDRLTPPESPAVAHRQRARGGMFERFAAASGARVSAEELLARLDDASGMEAISPVLDLLVASAEGAAREGNPRLAAEILHRVVRREREAAALDEKRSFMPAVRRLCRGPVLRAVVTGLARDPRDRDEHLAVLARAGDDGVDAVVEELINSTERAERRVYFDALVGMKSGVPTLMHMLADPRWFVARNAAALLGEMGATEAEDALSDLVYHDDERVRHAATVSLMQLGTPRSVTAIEQALRDRAPQIRLQAIVALLARPDGCNAEPLIRALADERDEEVQAALLAALGRTASPEAVAQLARTAEPDRGLFWKKPASLRVAAVKGLAEAGTPEALAALRALVEDRVADVRDAARAALPRSV